MDRQLRADNGAVVPLATLRRSADWRAWGELARGAAPFFAPEFFALTRPLVPAGEALVVEARRDDALIGVLPLVDGGDGALAGLRTDHSPEFDFVGSSDGLDAVWRTLSARAWTELDFELVPTHSLLATRLPALARADGCRAVVRHDAGHRWFSLPGFEARMNAKFRTNLARCERKAGAVALERLVAPSRAALDEALAIEAMAWKGAAGTDIAHDQKVAHLYRSLARLFGRRRQASLYFLRVDGRRVAMLLAVEDRRTLWALKIGYDPAYAALSPGHLLVWKVAADAERRALAELNFVGRDSEWKQKWAHDTHAHVAITIYRDSARGRLRYAVNEVWKPRLHAFVAARSDGARTLRSPLRRRCQRADLIGTHTLAERVRGRLDEGLGIRSGMRRALSGKPETNKPREGTPSRFAEGSWVRVRDEAAVRATLDAQSKLRGLVWVPSQWQACGGVYRVTKQVRRIRDDQGRFRAVSGSVLLDGVSCAGRGPEPAGCGRHCPLIFRDEWLEPAPAPRRAPPAASIGLHARVRSADEITAGLDLHGRKDGLTFMPEMAAHAGKRFRVVERLEQVYEHDRWTQPPRAIYILDGLHCSGAITGKDGPCDRACALLWHEDWLMLEAEPRAAAATVAVGAQP